MAQKSNLIPKIKCTILLEQLYCMYYNTRPKSAQNEVIIMCFHPSINCPKSISKFCNQIISHVTNTTLL
jgi:hypothetical protein